MKTNMILVLGVLFLSTLGLQAQKTVLPAPTTPLSATLEQAENVPSGWQIRVQYDTTQVTTIPIGLTTEQQSFDTQLTLISEGKQKAIHESYTALHGKRSQCTNEGHEQVFTFRNAQKAQCSLILRVYDDGVTFRYALDAKKSLCKDGNRILSESTAYRFPADAPRWVEPWTGPNEELYLEPSEALKQGSWCYPALFADASRTVWTLVTESDVDANNCASRLDNSNAMNEYAVAQPTEQEGRGTGEVHPVITLPWQSPWRVMIIGGLNTLVESTLVEDVARPSVVENTDWVKPGAVSWNYWSTNHGTKSYETVCKFADLAATMHWPYTLLDWEWDTMQAEPERAATLPHGGNLEDAINYIHGLGVEPLMWYNSCGPHAWAVNTPMDRMLTHESRVKEFAWLNQLGVKGVKVDFFESEKQNIVQYYLDILKDAADAHIMVYFHGCMVPRGWSRTYPHLMTMESIRGGEWYCYDPDFPRAALRLNCLIPFTRNAVGPMDYTPITFTHAQHPHLTTYANELALTVLFESGMQHMADRPEGYLALPEEVKDYLSKVPVAWDDTKYVDGEPSERAVLARRSGETWYIGGITSNERDEQDYTLKFTFLPEGKQYDLLLLSDGVYDESFQIQHLTIDRTTEVPVHLLLRGGFTGRLTPVQ